MGDFKWAIVGDIHIGVRNDSKIFHNIINKFFSQLVNDLKSNNISTVILLGDLFERRKFINFDTLMNCKENVFNLLKNEGIRVISIAGNHDVYYKNTNRINSIDLLLTKDEYPNMHSVTQTAEELEIDGVKVLFVPWVNQENIADITDKINKTEALYMVSHLDMAGFEMHKGAVSDHGHFEMDFLTKFDKVITGHYHTKSNRGNVFYLGTPYETSWNDYSEDKGWHIFENGSFEFVKSDIKTFHRFVYDDRSEDSLAELIKTVKCTDLKEKYVKLIVKSKKRLKFFEKFIQLIESKLPIDLNIIDETNFIVETKDSEAGEFKDTLSVIKSYISDDIETDLNKERLFKNMAVLYQSAIELGEDE